VEICLDFESEKDMRGKKNKKGTKIAAPIL